MVSDPETGIRAVKGDITRIKCDIIVNAANRRLLGGGGVDGAIHRAAGPELMEYCRNIREIAPGVRCRTGEAVITPGFGLPSKHVIHTVGPVWSGGGRGEDQLLESCYRNSLELAESTRAGSISFPAISCGVYGFPVRRAAGIAAGVSRDFMSSSRFVREIILVAFDEGTLIELRRALSSP